MKNVPTSFLAKRGVVTEGQQFFILLWLEQFHVKTIDTYRCKAMNSKTIIEELLEVLEFVDKGIWDAVNIKLVSEEAIKIIEKDKVLANRKYYEGLKAIITSNKTFEEPVKKILANILDDLNRNYWTDLRVGLKEAMDNNCFEEIAWFTKSMTTELINLGFNREYLYNLCEFIFFTGEPCSFEVNFYRFIHELSPKMVAFITYIKLYPNSPHVFPQNLLNITFLRQFNFQEEGINQCDANNDFFHGGEPKVFAKCKVNSRDPYSAAIDARSQLGYALDLIHYGYQKDTRINIHEQSLIIENNKCNYYYSMPILVGYMKNSQEWLSKIDKQLSDILNAQHIADQSKDKLRGALRYFRLSKESLNIEHQFLNLWIALEYLIRSGSKTATLIESISMYIPKMLSLEYAGRLIRDILDNIARCKINVPDEVKPYLDTKNKERFIDLVRNEDLYNKLLAASNANPLLCYRLKDLSNILSTSKQIKDAIEKNCSDISMHLSRMYRIRNRIVHSAAHNLEISGITSNLVYYVTQIINTLLYELSSNSSNSDLWDVFMKYQFTYDQYNITLKKDRSNVIGHKIIIKPTKLLYP